MSMTDPEIERIERIPMSWEEFVDNDDPRPTEYYGGCLVVMSPPSKPHQRIIMRLRDLLLPTVPAGHELLSGWGWSPAGVQEYLIPDLMIFPETDEDFALRGRALLVVEVLSTNRRDDLVAKHYRYGKWGADSYWIVDRRDHQVLTYRLEEDHFVETGRFTGGRATLTYDAVEVPVDVDALLAS